MSDKAKKLLERLRKVSGKGSRRELIKLYRAYGFDIREGGKHDVATHPDYPHLRGTIGKHNELTVGFFKSAAALIDELEALKAIEELKALEELKKKNKKTDDKSE